MKTKKAKFNLKKQTVTNLSYDRMHRIKGGRTEQGITIPPCNPDPTYSCYACTDTCDCDSNPNYITCICK